MCGIVGIWAPDGNLERETVKAMTDSIAHRGPDMSGIHIEQTEPGTLGLGHRRLSILDVSENGSQPFDSSCGRYVLCYNGEIYNHLSIRAELEGEGIAPEWTSTSDTETLIEAISKFGLDGALSRANGMFAFALWDRLEKSITLARDRFGEKPLYYGFDKGRFMFASELKALKRLPGFDPALDHEALSQFFALSYVPAPLCIYAGLSKLLPAHRITLDVASGHITEQEPYWDLREVAKKPPFEMPEEALMNDLEEHLFRAVESRSLSDVPLGCFLSGGVDSAAITALMQSGSETPVETFSIGFEDRQFDEAPHARAVSKHLGTSHHEAYLSSQDAFSLLPELGELWDEPFADSSQIPTYFVNKLAKEHVTVCLSGDAGDELFAGYNRHHMGLHAWNRSQAFPAVLRPGLAWALERAPVATLDKLQAYLPAKYRVSRLTDRLPKLARVMACKDVGAYYRSVISHGIDPMSILAFEIDAVEEVKLEGGDIATLRAQIMLADQLGYLPNDVMTKVDRASMAVSLEARVPFLDHELVEFAWRLPDEMRVRDGVGKWALREILYRHVPRNLIERPKTGFSMPIENWLRGPLRDFAEELLSDASLGDSGVFDVPAVRGLWHDFQSGRRGIYSLIWNILVFQIWWRSQKPANH